VIRPQCVNETFENAFEYRARVEWKEYAHREACACEPQPFNKIHFYIEMKITGYNCHFYSDISPF